MRPYRSPRWLDMSYELIFPTNFSYTYNQSQSVSVSEIFMKTISTFLLPCASNAYVLVRLVASTITLHALITMSL